MRPVAKKREILRGRNERDEKEWRVENTSASVNPFDFFGGIHKIKMIHFGTF